MEKFFFVCLCFLFLCGCGPADAAEAEEVVEIVLNGTVCEVTPDIDGLSDKAAGGIWDSSGEDVPMLCADAGDVLTLRFDRNEPTNVSVKKYDIFDMKAALGASSSRSGPENMELTYEQNEASVCLEKGDAKHQLILFTCEWTQKKIRYGFVVSYQ